MTELLAAAFLVLLSAALAALAARGASQRRPVDRALPFALLVAGAVLLAVALANRVPPTPPPPPDLPLQLADDAYVTSDRCQSCHPRQYETWHASYHRTMTQVASPETVKADFGDVQLRFDGERYRMFEHDGRFFGEMPARGRPGAHEVVPLKQITGSHHMQIFWHPTGQGRTLRAFPLVYLLSERRWVPRQAAFVTPPGAPPAPASEWNRVCLECHATHSRPRTHAAADGGADSRVAELGIACEACHGPGGEHVAANRQPARRYRLHLTSEPDPTIVDPSDLPHVRASQVCGQCHSVKTFFDRAHYREWIETGSRFRPGDDLEEKARIVSNATRETASLQRILAENPGYWRSLFWDDGIVRVAGREYNALIESPCFQRGELSCLSCHTLHAPRDDPRELREWANDQLAPGMDTNHACTQCHADFTADDRVASHSRHPAGSSGSECQNCHMPHTTYGLLKAIRGHEISSPRVAGNRTHGRPNACNLCHLDRSLGWTADALQAWYGIEPPALSEDDRRISAGVRWALEGDAGLRALVAWSMGWEPARETSGTDWMLPYLLELSDDPYDAVRIIAGRSARSLPGVERALPHPLAPPQARARAIASIRQGWRGPEAASAERARRTLFDDAGRIETAEFQRLLDNRDTRPLNLAE